MGWKKIDEPSSIPVIAPSLIKKPNTRSNADAMYKAADEASVPGIKVGAFPEDYGWVLRKEGTGGRAGRITYEIMQSFSPQQGNWVDEKLWPEFSVTVGDSGEWIGYSDGSLVPPPFNPPVGSISNQPYAKPSHELYALYDDSGVMTAIFEGDMRDIIAGRSLTVEDETLDVQTVNFSGLYTTVTFFGDFPDFQASQTYDLRFIPAVPAIDAITDPRAGFEGTIITDPRNGYEGIQVTAPPLV